MTETLMQRSYKDTMFRMLFKEKENLLSLYNAVNPNMPLRDLIYVTKVLQNITRNESLYSRVLIKLPAPRFVVFYNGTEPQPEEQVLRLSEAFEKRMEKPELELMVKVYNINSGHNQELMEACCLLKEYAQYVEQVRKFAKKQPFQEAVEQAVDYCIRNGILADFLRKNRAEAIAVSIFEYDEEKHLKSERELAYKSGEEAGIAKGIEQGRQSGKIEGEKLKLIKLVCKKAEKGQSPEEIAEALEEKVETILPIYKLAIASATEYDSEKIYKELNL